MVRTLKEEAEKFLANVPEEQVFWCNDGRILRSMVELKQALESMSDETFAYHANTDKNDFAKWVTEVIGDERLARDLQKSPTRSRVARQVASRISILTKRLT